MTAASTTQRADLSKQAVQSTVWAYGSFVSGKLLVFVSTIILARLLLPSEFGLMGYCLIGMQYLDILNGFGVGHALIARRDKVEEAANAALIIGLVSGMLLFAVSWFGAPYLAAFFDEERITTLFRALAIVIPISAVGAVPSSLIQRSLRFKAKFVPDIGRSIAKGVISVVLAWQGYGVWSLVIGQIAGEVVATAVFFALAGWRPTRLFDRQVTREVMGFGSHIISIGIAGAVISNFDYLLVGKVLGATALGFYTFAYRIPDLIIRNTNVVIGKVAFPLLAQVQSDAEELRLAYGTMLRYVSLFTIPAGIGMALIAPRFVSAFFPDRWEPATGVMQLIALALAIASVGHLPGIIYKAVNRPEILNWTSFLKLAVTAGVLWYCVRWDITGVAAGQVGLAVFFVVIDMVVVWRVLDFGGRALLRAIAPSLLCTLAMTIVVVLLNRTMPAGGIAGLMAIVAVAVVVFIVTLATVSAETVASARNVLRSALSRA
ncbi:MAG TPA: lipopolysaccharide biosynthesis protein [Thermomicrobiales bacterium]|nr:lipopolysaccharide biosynthesis protein [Thermomicrobiales bacterium]